MEKKNKKGQVLIYNLLILLMVIIIVFFTFKLLGPIISAFKTGKSISVQIVESLLLPLLFISFTILVFKVLRRGEGAI